MKKISFFLLTLLLGSAAFSQLSITATGTAFTENFDGMGSTATASLPTSFKMGTDWATGAAATTLAAGTTGAGSLTGTSGGGFYNFANGVTASATDRAPGFLNSGSYTSPRSVIVRLTNNTGTTITSLSINFDYEKYRSGTRAFDWSFFHGSASAPATAEATGNQNYPGDVANTTIFNPPTTTSKSVTLSSLSIANGSDYYLRWTLTGVGGSSNGQAMGIDNFSVTANGGGPVCSEPASQPTVLILTPTPTSISGSFTASAPVADDYVAIRSTSNTLTVLPADGTIYTAGQIIGNGVVVASGASTTFTDAGLTPSTTYYYFVFANNNDNCSGGPNYNVTVNAGQNNASAATPALPACVAPAAAPSGLVLTPLSTSISGSFTAAAGANRYLVVRSLANTLSATPSSGTTYAPGQIFGGGIIVSYGAGSTFASTGLTASTQYYFFVFAASGECTGEPVYFNTSLDGVSTTTAGGGGIPIGYYDPATGLSCAPLKTALYNIVRPTVANPSPDYDGICIMYPTTDFRRSDDNLRDIIWDMYSDNPGAGNAEPYEFEYCVDVDGCTGNCSPSPAPNNTPIPGTAEGLLYNREHSFPRSWFGGAVEPMNSDAMHIFPTDKEVNAQRGSWPYGETTTPTWTSLNGSKLGPSTFPGYTGTVFEPINEYKGDFARAQFYMATAYENLVAGWPGSILNGSSYQTFDDWYLQLLYKWHVQDPVNAKEIDRNNAVYVLQGNRNPFVDHPEYVANVWANGCLTALPVTLIDFAATKNSNGVLLKWIVGRESNVKYYEIESSTDGRTFVKTGEITAAGLSSYSFTDARLLNTTVIYYRLKTVDQDGRFTQSNIVAVKFENGYTGATVYPNPANTNITVQLLQPLTYNGVLQVADITGRVVWQQQAISGQKTIAVNTQQLAAGRYFIKLTDKNNSINQSFIIAR